MKFYNVRIIAISKKIKKSEFKKVLKELKAFPFRIFFDDSLFAIDKKTKYFAGSETNIVKSIHRSFEEKNSDIIWVGSGGYGAISILPKLDYRLIKKNKKPIIGYSDITGILLALHKRSNIDCIHGPMPVSKNFSLQNKYLPQFFNLLNNRSYELIIKKSNVFNKGNFRGKVLGGNLTLISSLIGTKFEPNFNNKIIFLEDVNETPQALFNKLSHLKLAGKFKKVKAILLGRMNNCGNYQPFLKKFFKDFKIPILWELDLGHSKNMFAIRLGDKIFFDNTKNKLIFLKK